MRAKELAEEAHLQAKCQHIHGVSTVGHGRLVVAGDSTDSVAATATESHTAAAA
jgi:hypothetical protein